MLRQNQIGVKQMASDRTIPTPKRFICGSAHCCISPPEIEYSISHPIVAQAQISRYRLQLT